MRRVIPACLVTGGVAFVFTVPLARLIYLVSFVDDRWYLFLVANVFGAFILWGVTALLAIAGTEIPLPAPRRRKPKGWRKLRREAEERAYIRELERELGL